MPLPLLVRMFPLRFAWGFVLRSKSILRGPVPPMATHRVKSLESSWIASPSCGDPCPDGHASRETFGNFLVCKSILRGPVPPVATLRVKPLDDSWRPSPSGGDRCPRWPMPRASSKARTVGFSTRLATSRVFPLWPSCEDLGLRWCHLARTCASDGQNAELNGISFRHIAFGF